MHGGVGRAGTHPSGQGLPLGIVLRIPVLASGMGGIATRIGGQRVHQQATREWIPGDYHPLPSVEILARLLFVPVRRAG